MRRWVGRTLYEIRETGPKEWLWVLDEVSDLLDELPPEGSHRLIELWKQIPEGLVGQSGTRTPLERLRKLLIRLCEQWNCFRVIDWHKDVPRTNNDTEKVIGRMKTCPERRRWVRSRTVRGYKSWQGMWAALLLIGL